MLALGLGGVFPLWNDAGITECKIYVQEHDAKVQNRKIIRSRVGRKIASVKRDREGGEAKKWLMDFFVHRICKCIECPFRERSMRCIEQKWNFLL